ncbi:MAG: ATP-binding protein [Mizugakiibacter sp.]|uniref:ATP-binding protein n=1 Tax=Mizugakiibacter sp. TaxID=1972610 RepID=UPI0031BF449C|nr:hypothetical protein [Xanthomonadaceae bacterium]
MKRGPSTFALVLALVALALLLALGLSGLLSTRARLHMVGETYGRLIVVAALAADDVDARRNAGSAATLAELERAGARFSTQQPPAPTIRVAPALLEVGRTVGRLLGDPARVAVTQTPESQVWVRSAHDPRRWIVLRAASYRRAVIQSMLLTALIAGLMALAAAALAARLLTRPLERLAVRAEALLAGAPVHDTLTGSPREVRRLADAIGQAGARLRGVARERELMLAGISHDLRTPLARLRLALELGDAGDPQRRAAMVADLEQLDGALEQCLAFVRDGRDEATREVDIATLAGQLLALRGQPDDWQFDGPAQLPAQVRPSLLRRAIGNLMDNAERHGAAPFRVALDSDAHGILVSVSDHGPGVPPELLGQLGRPFLRGDRARSNAGTGLGLSIAMRAAELHGGRLDLRNAHGGGFVATLHLPCSPAAP